MSDPSPPAPPRRKRRFLRAGALLPLGALVLLPVLASTCKDPYAPYEVRTVVPSPSGARTLLRTDNEPSGPRTLSLLTQTDRGGIMSTEVLDGFSFPKRGTVVAGWDRNDRLLIGWPVSSPIPPNGRTRATGVEIAYVHYEPDLANEVPRRFNQATLTQVRYSAETVSTKIGQSCIIHVTGRDGRLFDTVTLSVISKGMLRSLNDGVRMDEQGITAMSLRFAVGVLPGGHSPPFTATQAKLGNIESGGDRNGLHHGPFQDRLSLEYSGYQRPDGIRIFHMLRDGGYRVRFSLTFGSQQIEYLVPDPITREAAEAYQACEAQTWTYPLAGKGHLSN